MPQPLLRRLYVRWLPLALALVAIVNIGINEFLPASGQALRLHEDGSLTHLVHTEQLTVDRRFGFYLELGEVAAGGTLVVSPEAPVDARLVRGLADVMILEVDYDPHDLPPSVIPSGDPIGPFSTVDGDVPYWIIPGKQTEGVFWLGRTPEGIVVVPVSVAPLPGDSP